MPEALVEFMGREVRHGRELLIGMVCVLLLMLLLLLLVFGVG
jgi:hypothetical protein